MTATTAGIKAMTPAQQEHQRALWRAARARTRGLCSCGNLVGMDACHTCDNPPCCNPVHIQPGTASDNSRDMVAKGRQVNHESLKTHCKRGHPFDEANTYLTPNGRRCCRSCVRFMDRESRKR